MRLLEVLKRLFSRQLAEKSSLLQEDLRKIGLVLTGAGILAIVIDSNFAGFLVMIFGIITWIFGLTDKRTEDD